MCVCVRERESFSGAWGGVSGVGGWVSERWR